MKKKKIQNIVINKKYEEMDSNKRTINLCAVSVFNVEIIRFDSRLTGHQMNDLKPPCLATF